MSKLHSILMMSVALCAACSKKDDKAATPAPESKTAAKEEPKAATPTPAKEEPKKSTVTVDPEIARMVKEIVAKCDIQVDSMYVSCNGNEPYAVINYAADKKISNAFESLAEIALTDGAKDPKVLVAVVATWNSFQDHALEKQNSTPAAAERVLELYPKAAKASSWQYAAAIPLIAGKRAELTAIVNKLPPEQQAPTITWYLDWGGIAALPDVQAFYKGAANDDVRRAAAWSVGVSLGAMYQPENVPDADKAQMCDWAKTLVKDPATPEPAFGGAAESLSRCKGAYLDDVLAAVEVRLGTGKLTDTLANSLHHMCWAEGLVGGTPNGSKEQCAKAFALVEKGLSDKDASVAGRTAGLYAVEFIGQNAPDLKAKAKALAGKFSADKDLGQAAKVALDGLNKK